MSSHVLEFIRSVGLDALKRPPFNCSVHPRGNLVMIHLNKNTDLDTVDPRTLILNGLILTSDLQTVVCANHPVTREMTSSFETANENKDLVWFHALDGTMIRLYYFEEEWQMASNKKISALHAFWGRKSRSFGDMALDCWKRGLGSHNLPSELDTAKTYMCLLRHKEAMTTLPVEGENVLKWVGSVHNDTFETEYLEQLDCTAKERLTIIQQGQLRDGIRGLIAIDPCGRRFKVDCDAYTYLHDLKGHEQDLLIRYFELGSDPEMQLEFQNQYGDRLPIKDLSEWTRTLTKMYVSKFVQRKMVQEPQKAIMFLLYRLHDVHKETGDKIGEGHVRDLFARFPRAIATLVRLNLENKSMPLAQEEHVRQRQGRKNTHSSRAKSPREGKVLSQ